MPPSAVRRPAAARRVASATASATLSAATVQKKAAQDGTEALCHLFARAGHVLGIGVSHLIALFNPKKIVVTGKGVQAGELIFGPMHAALEQHVSAKFGRRTVEIMVQEWTEQDWARGAGAMVLQELYKSPVGQMATHQ